MAKLSALALRKLKSSGLSRVQGEKLGMYSVSASEATKLVGSEIACDCLAIPYFDPHDGWSVMYASGSTTPFVRLRLLEVKQAFGVKIDNKYTQPSGTGSRAYFPRVIDWTSIVGDVSKTLYITEGELKAAKGCVEGLPTIGLGGVNSYSQKSKQIDFLPELEAIDWLGRKVYFVFDSDLKDNKHVQHALFGLAEKLYVRGAFPWSVWLPQEGGGKVGLDDYLVSHKLDDFMRYVDLALPLTIAHDLVDLNDKYAYVRKSKAFYSFENNHLLDDRKLGIAEAAGVVTKYTIEVTNDDDEKPRIKETQVSKIQKWVSWKGRREVNALVYSPGQPAITYDNCVNIWPGWGCTPKRGDCAIFHEFIDYLFDGSPKEDKRWFLQWLAYPLQHPGTKLFTSVVMHSTEQGTGKSFLGIIMGHIYGENFVELAQAGLSASFNEWTQKAQFVMGDDITGSNQRGYADLLKKMITQKTITVNKKFEPTYVINDCINYYFTTNQPDAFYLEDSDRRFFINTITAPKRPDKFYVALDKWAKSESGPPALFYYLLHHVDTSSFNPSACARQTVAKEIMHQNGLSDLGAFVRALRDAPDYILQYQGKPLQADLYSSRRLLDIYNAQTPSGMTSTTATAIARECTRAGFAFAHDSKPIMTPRGLARVIICRNHDKWRKASLKAITEHLRLDMSPSQKY